LLILRFQEGVETEIEGNARKLAKKAEKAAAKVAKEEGETSLKIKKKSSEE